MAIFILAIVSNNSLKIIKNFFSIKLSFSSKMFKILGHVPVRSMLTENAEHNAFIIFGGQKAITVSLRIRLMH